MAGALITMPLVLHALGQEGFGVWAAAAAIAWMTTMVDWGVGNALLTAVARARARDDGSDARRHVAGALRLGFLIGALELVLGLTVVPLIAPPSAVFAYQIAAIGLALNVPASLAAALWGSVQRMHVVWTWEAVQTVVTLGSLFLLTGITADPRWYVAITFGAVLLTNWASLVHVFLVHPELRPGAATHSSTLTELLGRGLPYLILGLATTLAVHSDSIIALSLLGAEATARMAVTQRACVMALNLLWVLTQPLWPAFTDAVIRGDSIWIRRRLVLATAVVTVCAVCGSAVLVAWGAPLLHLWMGGGLDVEPIVLWAMAIWIVVPALGRIPDVLLNALGVVWFQVGVAVVYSALAFGLKLTLAGKWGVAGILAATGISYGLTHLPAYWWWVRRWIERFVQNPTLVRP